MQVFPPKYQPRLGLKPETAVRDPLEHEGKRPDPAIPFAGMGYAQNGILERRGCM